jgi:ribosomal protein L40E
VVNLVVHSIAEQLLSAIGDREYVCLKGYVVKSQSPGYVKFVLRLEDPGRYLLIPEEDIYFQLESQEIPFKGHMIWTYPKKLRVVEPSKPLYEKPQHKICPKCKGANKMDASQCVDCGFTFNLPVAPGAPNTLRSISDMLGQTGVSLQNWNP